MCQTILISIVFYILIIYLLKFAVSTIVHKRFCKTNKSIPAILWKSGPKMTDALKKHFEKLELVNHPYKVRFIDDESSRDMVKSFGDSRVLNAYDTLVPGAYKADLLRYILLYKYGGVWSDIKHQMKVPIDKLVNRNDKLVLTKDKYNGIQISFMAAIPGLEVFHKAIYRVVTNVEKRYYGRTFLHPTGPQMFRKVLSECKGIHYKFVMKDCDHKLCHIDTNEVLIYKDHSIAPEIPHNNYMVNKHYSHLWKKRKIYYR